MNLVYRNKMKIFIYSFQVLDTDLVQEEECDDHWYENRMDECQSVNDRFYKKCSYYNNCGNGGRNRRMFQCSKVKLLITCRYIRNMFCISSLNEYY